MQKLLGGKDRSRQAQDATPDLHRHLRGGVASKHALEKRCNEGNSIDFNFRIDFGSRCHTSSGGVIVGFLKFGEANFKKVVDVSANSFRDVFDA